MVHLLYYLTICHRRMEANTGTAPAARHRVVVGAVVHGYSKTSRPSGSPKTVGMTDLRGQLFVNLASRRGVVKSRHCHLCLRQRGMFSGSGESAARRKSCVADFGSNGNCMGPYCHQKPVGLSLRMKRLGGKLRMTARMKMSLCGELPMELFTQHSGERHSSVETRATQIIAYRV